MTGTNGQIVDGNGNVWSLVSTPNDGLRVALNGIVDPTYNFTAFVTKLEYSDGKIYQENVANQWWYKIIPSTPWTPTSAPPNTPTVYSWLGYPAFLNNPYAWTPFGLPGPADIAWVGTGIAYSAPGASIPNGITLGSPNPALPADLVIINNGSTNINVSSLSFLFLPQHPFPFGDELYGNIFAVGTNNLAINYGFDNGGATYPGSGSLSNYGTLNATVGVTGQLTVYNYATLTGSFNVEHGSLQITGTGTIQNAAISTTTVPHSSQGDVTINDTIGPNVTINVASAGDPPGTFEAIATIDSPITQASDVINLGIGAVLLGQTITFMQPPPEQINIDPLYAINPGAVAELVFNTDFITGASYANGVLDLTEVGGGNSGVMPIKTNLPNPTQWVITQTAPNASGIVQATLLPTLTSYPVSAPAGGTLIHVT